MKDDVVLLRQIHPTFVQAGRVTSQAFRPTPKDENLLSVDDGSLVSPEASFTRFNSTPNCESVGVKAVTKGECSSVELSVIQDGSPYPEHCSIDFTGLGRKPTERKAKQLRNYASQRGWLHRA